MISTGLDISHGRVMTGDRWSVVGDGQVGIQHLEGVHACRSHDRSEYWPE